MQNLMGKIPVENQPNFDPGNNIKTNAMKTLETKTQQTEQVLSVYSKRDMLLVKTTLILFGAVINICFVQLFF